MSTDFKPGDVVDIEIKGAKVTIVDGRFMEFQTQDPDEHLSLNLPVPGVTITRRAPQPQAGDVWRIEGWGTCFVTGINGDLTITDVEGLRIGADSVDFTGATRLYPPTDQPERPMLRRFEDRDGDVWTETGPESNLYRAKLSGTWGRVEAEYGPLKDLPPIPAEETS